MPVAPEIEQLQELDAETRQAWSILQRASARALRRRVRAPRGRVWDELQSELRRLEARARSRWLLRTSRLGRASTRPASADASGIGFPRGSTVKGTAADARGRFRRGEPGRQCDIRKDRASSGLQPRHRRLRQRGRQDAHGCPPARAGQPDRLRQRRARVGLARLGRRRAGGLHRHQPGQPLRGAGHLARWRNAGAGQHRTDQPAGHHPGGGRLQARRLHDLHRRPRRNRRPASQSHLDPPGPIHIGHQRSGSGGQLLQP